ncbi:hypothetical protein JXA88_07065 [Candidatus Fermentibacteria bacterium]|nr:hypothetical protein [Candidatus Fermentibacteria bacterium]
MRQPPNSFCCRVVRTMRSRYRAGIRQSITVCSLGVMAVCGVVHGRVINVPGDHDEIDIALWYALSYDTILVAPGVYPENIVWPLMKQGIKLMSTHGPQLTILDGGGEEQVLGVYSGVDTTTVIRGFTIRNGHASGT